MLTPLQEQAVELYRNGKNLREVADEVGRSHEWVRKTLLKGGVDLRERGQEMRARPACLRCGKPCQTLRARYCSRTCLSATRFDGAMDKINVALDVLKSGGSYTEAAKAAGYQTGWHLYGRLHHFGLIPANAKEPPEEATEN